MEFEEYTHCSECGNLAGKAVRFRAENKRYFVDLCLACLEAAQQKLHADVCEVAGCEEPVAKEGLCWAHDRFDRAANAGE